MRSLWRWIPLFLIVLTGCAGASASTDLASPRETLDSLPPLNPIVAPAASVAATTTTTAAPKAPITLGFAGDTSFTHGLHGRDPLGDVSRLLTAADFTAVNLETTVGEDGVGRALDKTYIFRSPPSSVALLTDAGIDAVSLANNHTLDYGREGLLRTLELLDDGGLLHFGAGEDREAAYAARVADVGDWRIGLVGFTHIECGWVADDRNRWPESAWACPGFEQQTIDAVAAIASEVDLTIVMVHWGIELDHCPQPYQRELAAAWSEAGADLIIGSHPHVLQGIERYDDTWVVHSTGNFAFPSARGPSARTAYFTAKVAETGISLTVTPLSIVDGRPRPAGVDAGTELLSDLSRWSTGWSIDESGRVSRSEEPSACA